MMEEFTNSTVQENINYFDIPHYIYKYQVENYNNTGFCMCKDINVNDDISDCNRQETSFSTKYYVIFSLICIVVASLMEAFDYLSRFGENN